MLQQIFTKSRHLHTCQPFSNQIKNLIKQSSSKIIASNTTTTATSLTKESNDLQQNQLQKLNEKKPLAFGYYFPKQWDTQRIYSLLDPSRKQIKQISIVQNKLGMSTGKVLFTFRDMQVMKKYIYRYNEDFIQTEDSTHKVVLKPFQPKTQAIKRQRQQHDMRFGVKLTNMDFDIDHPELERLAEDFGKIQFIDMPMRETGGNSINRGVAKIYFSNRTSCDEFIYFADGLVYKERKLRCSMIVPEQKKNTNPDYKFKQIQLPKVVMKWNLELQKRMIRNQALRNDQETKNQEIV